MSFVSVRCLTIASTLPPKQLKEAGVTTDGIEHGIEVRTPVRSRGGARYAPDECETEAVRKRASEQHDRVIRVPDLSRDPRSFVQVVPVVIWRVSI
jgi:hypothetical protein